MAKVDRDLIGKARALRNRMNFHEVILWSRLMSKKLNGYKFRRQQIIYNYITDFYCHELKLVIEVDGDIHNLKDQADYDKKRDTLLRLNGYHVLRLSNYEVEANLDAAVQKIKSFICTILSPSQGDHRGFSKISTVVQIGSLPLGGTYPVLSLIHI